MQSVMKPDVVRFLVSSGLAILVLIALNVRFGMIPAMGAFLSPFEGFWQLAEGDADRTDQQLEIPGLAETTRIVYDDDGIPHIFAETTEDLYFAQGYLVARERLWQMDFLARAAEGTLTEVIGEDALDYSRYMRNLGMVKGAENAVDQMYSDDRSRLKVEAYTAGVNEWMENLDTRKLPLEFKLLGYEPQRWTPLRTALVLMNISHTLTGRSSDFQMTNTLDVFGRDFINRFFPKFSENAAYYIPNEDQFDFDPYTVTAPEKSFTPKTMHESPVELPDPGIGSNNWVVDGSRTSSGNPLFSSDPHLPLTLPSIWIEMQLHGPQVNTYGVTLPGTPGVVIGFNEAISWGTTNAGSDAMDIYEIEFRDESMTEYRYDGDWVEVESREEIYRMPDGSEVIDTVKSTHHGPIVSPQGNQVFPETKPGGHAIRWTAHQPGNETLALYKFNRASSPEEFQNGLEHFHVPAQTFAYADTSGNIGLFHHGRFPVRWESQGRFISDGSDPRYDWQDRIPAEQMPKKINPERGYLGSANQPPVGDYYPYDIGWLYASNERGTRLHELLASRDDFDADSFRNMQTDDLSVEARRMMPFLLDHLNEEQLESEAKAFVGYLEEWDYRYHAESKAPVMFDRWWQTVYNAIWDPEFAEIDRYVRRPDRERTGLELKRNPNDSLWVSGGYESLTQLITEIFGNEFLKLKNNNGPPGEDWKWEKRQSSQIRHQAEIPGLGESGLAPGGTARALNANHNNHGPSWRLVVDHSNPLKAYGIYPGGTSGNPGSYFYDNFVDDWEAGELRELRFWQNLDEIESTYTITLIPDK